MDTYKRHRFPPDIISYAVWVYYRFNLSHRSSQWVRRRDFWVPMPLYTIYSTLEGI